MTLSEKLRRAVLQHAIEGKLTKQLTEDGNAEDLFDKIQQEKKRLIKGKNVKSDTFPLILEDEIPFEIPKNWKWVRLGEIGIINPKNNLDDNENVSFIPMKFVNENFSFSGSYKTEIKKWSDVKKGFTHFQRDDLLVAKITPCFENRKSTILRKMPQKYGAGSTEFHVFRSLYNELTDFVYLFTKSQYFIKTGESKMTGTAGQKRVGTNVFKNFLFPLPPLSEQKRIVKILEEILPEIDKLEEDELNLKEIEDQFPENMKNSILKAAMQGKLTKQLETDDSVDELLKKIENEKNKLINEGKMKKEKKLPEINEDEIPFEIPKNWKWVRLIDCANIYTGNSINKRIKDIKYTGVSEGYAYIATKDVNFDTSINYKNGIKIPFEESEFRNAYKGASLLCIEGGSAGRKIGILKETVCFGNKLCSFHPILINERFLFYYLQSSIFKEVFKSNLIGIIGGVGINRLKQMIIPIPSLKEQKRIVEKLDQMLPLCEKIDPKIIKTNKTY